ncbi:oligosaccharide flippase family protein [Dysgonomonas capnocytophagoides]|uniref:oligosaccharide flippase family protein n=1 Tax=Dysgonomonas capnocytophagoides TaxID=45254 RepID=UPI002A836737|nr:oligosaccharide flippase family protein [Dysgonomonas capnocytophagoides]
MNKIKRDFKKVLEIGLFNVLNASVINNVIAFLTNVLIVRILSKTEFGMYGYAFNIISLCMLFSGLGVDAGILQFCSEKRLINEKKQLYKFGLLFGCAINCLISLLILSYIAFFEISIPDAKPLFYAFLIWPILNFLFNYVLVILRTKKENKLYSKFTNLNSICKFIFACLGAYLGGVYGYLIGIYMSFIIVIIFFCYTKSSFIKELIPLSIKRISEYSYFLKYSLITVFNNGVSQLLYVIDVFLIGVFISNPDIIANYKASTQIPFALYFITTSVMIVIYPYIAEHYDNIEWIKNKLKSVMLFLFVLNLPITLILYFGAPSIIKLLYGKAYLDSVPLFKVLALTYLFATMLRIPLGNILNMLRGVKMNLINSIITGIANIVLDIILIKSIGSLGAALATLIVTFLSGLISLLQCRYLFKK